MKKLILVTSLQLCILVAKCAVNTDTTVTANLDNADTNTTADFIPPNPLAVTSSITASPSANTGFGAVAQAMPSKADSFPHLFESFHLRDYRPTVAGVVVPVMMLSYGFYALHNPTLQSLNHTTKTELQEPHLRTHVDNYLEYTPALSVYALNLMGIKGKHDFKERTIILGISSLLMSSTLATVKKATHSLRPDGSTYNSFPSGHTATSFMGAMFMWEEYKDVSPWYGIAGFAVAATTGTLRMYNNRHWLSDVVAGAGLGILSTKTAYWLYPKFDRMFSRKDKAESHTIILPTYDAQWKTAGLSLVFFH
jgi:hypothetical protein